MSLALQAARPAGGFTTRFRLQESSTSPRQFPVCPGCSRSHGRSAQAAHDVHEAVELGESVVFEDAGNCCSRLASPTTSLSASCPLLCWSKRVTNHTFSFRGGEPPPPSVPQQFAADAYGGEPTRPW